MVELGTSENSRIIDEGSLNDSLRVNELATNYIETGESYDRKATIVDTYFLESIAESQGLWLSTKNVLIGSIGRKQLKQNLARFIKEQHH